MGEKKYTKIGMSGVSFSESKEAIAIYAYPGGLIDRLGKLWVVSSLLVIVAIYSSYYLLCFLIWCAFSFWMFKRRRVAEFTPNGSKFNKISAYLPTKVQDLTLEVEEKKQRIVIPTRSFGGISSNGTKTALKIIDSEGTTLWSRSFIVSANSKEFSDLVKRMTKLTKPPAL